MSNTDAVLENLEKKKDKKRILAMDSQILGAIQKCGYYTFLSFLRHLKDIGAKPMPLDRGSLGHDILEVYYRHLAAGTPWDEAVDEGIKLGRKLSSEAVDLDDDIANRVVETFVEYAEYYRYDGLDVKAVEQPFMLHIYEDDELIIYYQGKIDLIAGVPNQGEIPFDHKFRGRHNEESKLNNQFIGYALATESNQVKVNEVGLQKTLPPSKKFNRQILSYSQQFKEGWRLNTIQWGKILDDYLQNNVWPKSFTQTLNGIQCKHCVFERICTSENEEEALRKIKQHYKIGERWDVTKVLEGDDSDSDSDED